MAYVTVGTEGTVASWGGAGSLYETILASMRVMEARVTQESNEEEITGLDATTGSLLSGIRSSSATLRGYGLATPAMGYPGSVAVSGTTYDLHVRSFDFVWQTAAVHDITELVGAPTWRSFRPDYTLVSGSFECHVDSDTALSNLIAAGSAAPTVTLLYTATAQLAGDAVLTSLGASVSRGQKNTATYSFRGTGNWSASGTGSIFGSGATVTFGQIPWSAGGTANPLVVATRKSNRTLTIADTFIRRLRLSCEASRPVMVEIDVVGSGTVTMA